MTRMTLLLVVGLAFVAVAPGADALQNGLVLQNERLRAEFDERGLTALHDVATSRTIRLAEDGFAVFAGDAAVESEFQKPAAVEQSSEASRVYRYESGEWRVRVVYELRAGWRFITKQIFLERRDRGASRGYRVHRIEMLRGRLETPIAEERRIRDGLLLRFADGAGAGPTHGLFLVLQNPFLQLKRQEQRLSLAYAPDMAAKVGGEPFASDRLCLGTCALGGTTYSAAMVPEWKLVDDLQVAGGPRIHAEEVDALIECVRAFLLWKPTRSERIHVGWCENDYQIDIATGEGRSEYKRIIDQAAAVGCRNILFGPGNSADAPLKDNRDAWGWENLLWLSMGQKLRRGEWDPARDKLPDSVQELRDYAGAKGVRFVAYVYPSLPFLQDKEWTAWVKGEPGGYLGADTGMASFQDWLLGKLVDFQRSTGAGGYSFDHWWIAYEDTVSSKYAQWAGCRRVLEELRRRIPEALIDGRQQYHWFGAWTWLAGTYPHPLCSDEQPESFRAFPDLHWSRVSGDRQRRTAWFYRMECFVPPEIMPGYMMHQTPRNDLRGQTVRTRFRPADWDLLGWRYSVMSSIATAPFNHVVNFLPARDEREFGAFGQADQKWLREWLDWTDRNMDLLRNVKPIPALGQPRAGGVDGWAAFREGRGVIFLFNPNYRPLSASFALDGSLGLAGGGPLTIRQLYPDGERGRLLVPRSGKAFWSGGERLSAELPGADALVLEVEPASGSVDRPPLIGAVGSAALRDGALELTGVLGEAGTERELGVLLPVGAQARSAAVNGKKTELRQAGSLVSLRVRFAGSRLGARQQIGEYDPRFAGGKYRAESVIPSSAFRQLEERKRLWPVDYTAEEREAAWLNSDRLLLFVNVAEPDDETMKVSLSVDGRPVPVRAAYTSIVRNNPKNTFVGWYADVSSLAPEVPHTFEVETTKLAPGQLQGLFLDTVEAELTGEIAAGN